MRFHEIISEDVAQQSLEELLYDWDGYDAADVWTGGRAELEKKLIAVGRTLNHKVSGMLYRGQGIPDDLYERVVAGDTVTIPMVKTLLSSWTHVQHVADKFAEVASENHGFNAVVIAYPAEKLKVVLDVTQIPTMKGEMPFNEAEVICVHQPLVIGPHNVTKFCPYEGD